MVDYIIDLTEESCTTSLTVRSDNLLVEGDCFSEAGLLEHIAQSSAAWNGIRHNNMPDSPIGVIGSIRNCSIKRLPQTGETIRTIITIVAEIDNKQVIHGQTFSDNNLISETDMNIALL